MEISIKGRKATILKKWNVNPDYYVVIVFEGETKRHIVLNEFNY
jgi:hypothetical protein